MSRQEQYLNMLLESSVDIIILFDQNSTIAYCSNSFLTMSGIPNVEAIKGLCLREIYIQYGTNEFVEEFIVHAVQRFSQVKSEERIFVDDSMFHTGEAGEERCFIIHTSPLLDHANNFDGMMVVYHDITELVHAQKKAEDAMRQAKAADKTKSRFLASMSHEIRTPMNVILGMGELMRTDNFDDLQLYYFSSIKKTARTLLEIINDILDFSKIEAGKMDLIPVHFSLSALYDHICSLTSFTIAERPLEFRHVLSEGMPETLYGDEVRWRQIITNLLNNAVKYTPEGYVSLHIDRVSKHGQDHIRIQVADTGIGIKPEDLGKLFGVFEQFDKKKNSGIAGTGLGLSIAKRMVEMMHGEIWAESEYGKGAVFTVLLPLIEGDPKKVKSQSIIPRVIASSDVKVLVVDDNPTNLTVALGFLATHNIQADTAQNGKQALMKVETTRYDLVFMDHMMPEMDGLETVKRIRVLEGSWYQKMPIIALSANAVQGMRERFLDAGMNDFISKPIEGSQLNRVLEEWLPKDKQTVNGHETTVAAEPKHDAALENLKPIKELDVAKGMSYIGNNKDAYLKTLRTFCSILDSSVAEIRNALSEENWQDYRIKVHALKGTFASIGAEDLSQLARSLEAAARSGDYAVCRSETKGFCAAMVLFRDELVKVLPIEDTAVKRQGDRQSLLTLLALFREYGDKAMKGVIGMSDKLDALASEAETMQFDATSNIGLQEICQAALAFDYAAMLKKTDALIQHWSAAVT